MQPVGELGRQESIDKPMAPDPAEPRKSRRDDLHPVVSAAAWTRACMAGVPVGFVDDVEEKRLEPLRQTADDFSCMVTGRSPAWRSLRLNNRLGVSG